MEDKASLKENRGLTEFERAFHMQQERLVDLEDISRRSNLIVFGVPDLSAEWEAALRTTVIKKLFQDKPGVTILSLARIHRLGRPKPNRPIILYSQDHRKKQAIWNSVKK